MSTNITDPAVEIEELRQRGASHLAELRKEAEERRAELARIDAEESVRLARAEQEFSAQLSARQREAHLAATRKAYAEKEAGYAELVTTADQGRAEVLKLRAALADAYKRFLHSEHTRVVAGEQLREQHRTQLAPLDPNVPEPVIERQRLVGADSVPVQRLAATHHPDIDRAVHQLSRHTPRQHSIYYVQGERREEWR